METTPATDAVHERLRKRIEALGLNPSSASRKAGLDKTYLRKLFERPGSRPGLAAAKQLSDVLGIAVADLTDDVAQDVVPAQSEPVRISDALPPVPVRGTVAGSHDLGAFQFDGSDVDYVDRYPSLAKRPRVYALYVEGDSMYPEHKPGAIRFVDPVERVSIGDTVVVTVMDPNRGLYAVLGNLAARGDEVVLNKLNPERQVRFSRLMVRSVHHVLTDNELAGK
jgi:SOS-response transcriptional repressor LexA